MQNWSFALLTIFIFTNFKSSNTTMLETYNLDKANEKVYVTALFYFKEGEEERFAKYRTSASDVFAENQGKLEKVIKPIKIVKGNIDLPDEIHFGVFKNDESFRATGENPRYIELVDKHRTPALENLVVIVSKDANSAVPQEIGDNSKIYAITLLTYKEGEEHKNTFEEYLQRSCEIMPEFGTHFEKFLVPTDVRGDLSLPSKVHLFYFDSMEGVQKMATDPRMLELYPMRDESVSSANLILGKSL